MQLRILLVVRLIYRFLLLSNAKMASDSLPLERAAVSETHGT